MKTKERFFTTYKEAVNWLHNDFVLCNNIAEVDQSILENARFDWIDEDENQIEIFQYYITNASGYDVQYLEENFGLLFTYSDLLDCYVLCVDHIGTSWDYVPCEVLTYGDEFCPNCKSYEELSK